ncbi:MAG: hypothetical protein FWE09_07335, partial [Treponema sp.]|nr:hypothetical protein [Treponema sp.]
MKRKMLALLVAACAAIACAGAAYAQTGSFGAESARANRFSAGFTALGLNLSYERDLSPMFSIGATAFGCYDFDLFVGGVMGVLAEARLSPWRFPLYFGLGLGYGMRQRTEYEGGRTPVSMQNAG